MSDPAEEIGKTYAHLTILGLAPMSKTQQRRYFCRCVCGVERSFDWYDVRSGHTQSCGCLRVIATTRAKTTHGESWRKHRTPEYQSWAKMIHRCTNPKAHNWKWYGGRGITVCERWRSSYANFLADMGRRPSLKHSIDRINNDGNYEPGNCRWATQSEQVQNSRASKKGAA